MSLECASVKYIGNSWDMKEANGSQGFLKLDRLLRTQTKNIQSQEPCVPKERKIKQY